MNEQWAWHTSSHSDGRGGDCVEVAEGCETHVRDTKNRESGHLSFPAVEWSALLRATSSK
ncbi:DUF397 domain-containing protein [Nocardiopsis alba]|jgi:hypothetical protein|uniref:DUF397 domain-containing protein n=1 Tax=Nocardiopsis alba TaxID=53437 RepID=A0A7K2IYZ3_9ACTN|nr:MULTISPECIES: DUF397 domain-containing protein [Nocardiopsis]MEC3891638.1 DUF397 domain-containing protein [Nocardiopsis sp. LDBS1602]MYR35027.1 DUF397 domain-containing protein [Nocardiopsis alba]